MEGGIPDGVAGRKKKGEIAKAGEELEKPELQGSASGNVRWCGCM